MKNYKKLIRGGLTCIIIVCGILALYIFEGIETIRSCGFNFNFESDAITEANQSKYHTCIVNHTFLPSSSSQLTSNVAVYGLIILFAIGFILLILGLIDRHRALKVSLK